jgi:hypothetical protein
MPPSHRDTEESEERARQSKDNAEALRRGADGLNTEIAEDGAQRAQA